MLPVGLFIFYFFKYHLHVLITKSNRWRAFWHTSKWRCENDVLSWVAVESLFLKKVSRVLPCCNIFMNLVRVVIPGYPISSAVFCNTKMTLAFCLPFFRRLGRIGKQFKFPLSYHAPLI